MLRSPHHCRLYWVSLYNLPTCSDLPITVDCTKWASIIYPHIKISPSLLTVLSEPLQSTHMLRSPIIVDCTEWTFTIYPHVEISHHCWLYWVNLYNLPTCWDLPIIVDCTEQTLVGSTSAGSTNTISLLHYWSIINFNMVLFLYLSHYTVCTVCMYVRTFCIILKTVLCVWCVCCKLVLCNLISNLTACHDILCSFHWCVVCVVLFHKNLERELPLDWRYLCAKRDSNPIR